MTATKRRLLRRCLLWSLAAVAVAALVASLLLRSRWVEERAADLVVERLERRLGVPVRLDSLSFELLPLGVELEGLVLGGASEGDPPPIEIPRLVAEAGVEALLRPRISLRRVALERPVLRLRFASEGGDNLVRWRRRDADRGSPRLPVDVEVGVVEVRGGWLELDQERLPLELEAESLEARFVGAGPRAVEGRVAAGRVSADVWGGRPEVESLLLRARIEPGRLDLFDGSLLAPGLDARLGGIVTWRPDRRLALDLRGRVESALANRWGLFDSPVDGRLEIDGGVAWQPGLWGFRGTVRAPRLLLFERRLRQVVAVVSADRNGTRIDLDEGGYAAGRLSGAITVGRRSEGRPVTVDLELEELRLSRLLEDQRIPVRGVEALVGGTVSYGFGDGQSRRGNGWAELAIAADPAAPAEVLTTAGGALLAIERGRVHARSIRLVSPAQQILAEGEYELDSGRGRFDYRIDTADAAELLARIPVEREVGEPLPAWWPGAGRGRVEGTLELDAGDAVGDVAFDLEETNAAGYSADRMHGSMRASARGIERLRLELLRPEGAMIVTGSVPFADPGGLSLSVDAAGWPIADLGAWIPARAAFDGRVSGRLELTGDPAAPDVELRLAASPLTLGGLSVREARLDLAAVAGRTTIREAEIGLGSGSVRLRGELEGEEWLSLSLDSSVLELGAPPFAALHGGALAGSLVVTGAVRGSLAEPELEAELAATELSVAGEPMGRAGEATTGIRWRGGRLDVEGSLLGLAEIEGGGRLDSARAALGFALSSSRLGELAACFAPVELPGFSGSAAGRLEVSGELSPGELPEVRLTLERLVARRGGLALENLEPVVLALAGGDLVIDSLYLGVPDSENEGFVSGRVRGLAQDRVLDLRFQSSLEADWFAPWLAGVKLSGGEVDAIASIRGAVGRPQINGLAELREARVLVDGAPGSFENLEAMVLLAPGEVILDRVRAGFAGGEVRMSGELTPQASWREARYRLQMAGEGLNLRYPEGWAVRGDAVLVLSSTTGGRRLSGRIDLDRAAYQRDVEVGVATLLEAVFGRRRIEEGPAEEALASTELDLHVRAAESLSVRNNVADLGGSADLLLRGTLARPVVFGRVEFRRGGKIEYAGSEYEIERGLLSFANPYRIEPAVDLVARTRLREYEVRLTLSGTPERLRVDLASDPPLADLDVLSLLAGGETTGGEGASVDAQSFLAGQTASLIGARAGRLFGLDKLRIDPLTEASGDLSSARVTLGKRLSRDLLATYSYDPSTTEQQILELEWSVSRSLVLLLTQNGDSSYAVDVLWQKAF